MDPDAVQEILRRGGVDVWDLIDGAVALAAADYGSELKSRRDGIVQRLYAGGPCRNCGTVDEELVNGVFGGDSPVLEEEEEEEDEVEEDEDEERKELRKIKALIGDPDQDEATLITLLKRLWIMDITFTALKESDIGRCLNGLKKHESGEVRRLVKQLIRKWKDLVDKWVKSSSPDEGADEAFTAEGDSPQHVQAEKHQNIGRAEDPPHSPYYPRSVSSERISKYESKQNSDTRREAEVRQKQSAQIPFSTRKANEAKDDTIDMERLASARKRLHDNYRVAENAKKQRTIQVMEMHEIPKQKNTFFARNKGGLHGRH